MVEIVMSGWNIQIYNCRLAIAVPGASFKFEKLDGAIGFALDLTDLVGFKVHTQYCTAILTLYVLVSFHLSLYYHDTHCFPRA